MKGWTPAETEALAALLATGMSVEAAAAGLAAQGWRRSVAAVRYRSQGAAFRGGAIEDRALQARQRACDAHLGDLRAVYGRPPADVVVGSNTVPRRLVPEAAGIFSSPAALCAD
jgi:hypothetical protein